MSDTGFAGFVRERLPDGSIGRDIPGVQITFVSEAGQGPFTVTTDDKGYYRISLPPGLRYRVTATHPDYPPYTTGQGFAVLGTSGFETFNIFLLGQPTTVTDGTLAGVTYEWELEGGQHRAIPWVSITFVSEDGSITESVGSDECGHYQLSLKVGRYRLTATHPDFPVYDPDGFVVIRPIEDVQVCNIFMGQPHQHGNLGGSVWERRADGSFGSKIAGVEITFISEDGSLTKNVTSLYDGSYRVELSPGRYRVTASHPDYEDYTTGSGFVVITDQRVADVFNIFMTRLDLGTWLDAHPAISASIIWEDAGGAHGWASWSAAQKAELRQAFDLARIGSSIPVADVPPNQATLADNQQVTTILAPADAWAYFKASVAQSLAAEIRHQLLWSIQDYSAPQLAQLFDSREMFMWNASPAGYRIDSTHGHVVPAPPARSYAFLGTQDLIGDTRLDTLSRVVNWCRANLVHFSGGLTAANMQDQWQYRGFPPMTRVLDGTVQTSQPAQGVRHRTAGCWGTVGLLRALMRAINIPAKLVRNAGHAQPWFMADSHYLSHGDDPYNALTTATPPIPAAEILIDQAQFDAWFGADVSDTDKAKNVGRRPRDLAIVYLPTYLLRAYCSDIANGRGHGNGQVFDILSLNYTVAQLEAQTLWTRMDAKIAGFGGCAHVP